MTIPRRIPQYQACYSFGPTGLGGRRGSGFDPATVGTTSCRPPRRLGGGGRLRQASHIGDRSEVAHTEALLKLADWLAILVHQESRTPVQIGERHRVDVDSHVAVERREYFLNVDRPLDG